MILDSLKNSSLYLGMHPLFKRAFDYLKSHDLDSLEPGKIVLEGEKLYISISEYEGKSPEVARLETHEKYIDIQIIISGTETMGWRAAHDCIQAQAPYNPEKDICFYNDSSLSYVNVHPGEFTVFFPGDGHAPCIGKGPIKKAVVKVLL
ncbi:MAG: YhcH/YjgK/YiaL family protein [Bacteroidales bacterium]|nr:YhcH/YjgK/YiaL family protein [Bacteroidales bacterium]MDD4361692.1 YhcH/YjgK/YiaL family protein [Bacteroidales bacterium]MDD4430505.1 YhcH/YjgK/YiaL family protein [Bacteroidales bacterium]